MAFNSGGIRISWGNFLKNKDSSSARPDESASLGGGGSTFVFEKAPQVDELRP